MLLAIIPARGGSKGIPRKNLALLNGKPLIEYTIEAAQQSRYVDEILLSTDDDEIANVGRRMGLNLSYRRPSELAADTTAMMDVLEHGIYWFEQAHGKMPDEVMLLQPTSPLRSVSDIDGAVTFFRSTEAQSLVSVHPMSEHPCECIVGNNANWEYLVPPRGAVRRQDYKDNFYFINGAIYLAKTEVLLSWRSFIRPHETSVFVMPRERGVDIDEELDMVVASALITHAERQNIK